MEAIYQRDSDQDGLTDAQELALGTNPLSADSDGDGRSVSIYGNETKDFRYDGESLQGIYTGSD